MRNGADAAAAAVNVGVFVGPPGSGALVDLTGSSSLAWFTLALRCVAARSAASSPWAASGSSTSPGKLCPESAECEVPFDES